ncbi:MAG: HupE/UreJ family protein [Alphaproteobacteria bacterium]|nr:HupE/UreJ family protein [Alphaproteobacteria bacterium]
MAGIRTWMLAFCLTLAVWPASAHRLGESYLYIDVTENGISGELHIRLADFAKAVPMDADRDGTVDDAEFRRVRAQAYAYLEGRVRFFADGREHEVRFGDFRFFGDASGRQVAIAVSLPTLGPPPDVIEAEYRFLFDGPDPAHRTMLIQSSSTRLRIEQNETAESLVFGPGAERQSLDLRPRPKTQILGDFFLHGMRQMMRSVPHLCVVVALIMPWFLRRDDGRRAPTGAFRGGLTLLLFAAVFVAALAAGAALSAFDVVEVGRREVFAACALSLGLLALDTWRPVPGAGRALVVLAAGLLLGLASPVFGNQLGLDRGFPEVALIAFAGGTMASVAVITAFVLPLFWLTRTFPAYEFAVLRGGSVAIAGLGVLWFAARLWL